MEDSNYYLVVILMTSGDHQKFLHRVVEAKNPIAAKAQALLGEAHTTLRQCGNLESEMFEEDDGQFIYQVREVQDLTESEYVYLSRIGL